MPRWIRVTAGCTAVMMLWTTLLGTGVSYAEETDEDLHNTVRTIVGRDSDGWAVVDIKQVTGKVIVLSPVVGRALDLQEGIKFSMFQGPSEFNRRSLIPQIAASVPGFREAVFMKRSNDRYGVRIEFTTANKTRFRTIPLKENDVKRIREYVENFDAVQSGDYKIHRSKTKIEEGDEYPKLTEEDVSFETQVPRFVLGRRMDGSLTLKDGQEIKGELVPVYDEGSILIEADYATRTIPVDDIERIRTQGNKSSSAMSGAIRTGVGSAISGALSGALAAWQSNGDVKEWTIFGAFFFGAAGFLTGLARGVGTGRSSEDIVLGPLGKSGNGKD
jgi:hypothetical protein